MATNDDFAADICAFAEDAIIFRHGESPIGEADPPDAIAVRPSYMSI